MRTVCPAESAALGVRQVTVLVALVSLFSGRLARSDTAMSGEISLRGNVLPVGGIREKVLAAWPHPCTCTHGQL